MYVLSEKEDDIVNLCVGTCKNYINGILGDVRVHCIRNISSNDSSQSYVFLKDSYLERDVLKSDTALAASGLCFILFVSYAITTVLLFLALRGDLPSLSKPEIPVVGVCIEETDMAGDANNAKSNAVNNNVQIVEVSSVVIKEDK